MWPFWAAPKVSDKLNVINNLLEKVDTLIIGGGMAYTFLAAQGHSTGTSLLDEEKVDYCKEMMAKAEAKGVKLLLPVDTTIAASFPNPIDAPIDVETAASDAIPQDQMGLGHRPKDHGALRKCGESCQDCGVERPHGCV